MTGTATEWNQYTFSQQLEKEFGVKDSDRRVPKFDDVDKPLHYNTGKVEAIEAIEASMSPEEYKGYLKGNTLKYLWRYQYKQKPLQDLQKADWYLRKLIKANGG